MSMIEIIMSTMEMQESLVEKSVILRIRENDSGIRISVYMYL